jgi:hypothetical protein
MRAFATKAFQSNGVLTALAVMSYASSALRDLVLLGLSQDKRSVDTAVVTVAFGSSAAAIASMASIRVFADGLSVRRFTRLAEFIGLLGATLIFIQAWIGLCLAVAGLMTSFHVRQTGTAANRKLPHLSVATFLATFGAFPFWMWFERSPVSLAGGFIVACGLQALAATVYSKPMIWQRPNRTERHDRDAARSWARGFYQGVTVYVLMAFVRALYLGLPAGQLAAASVALSCVLSVCIVLAAPIALKRFAELESNTHQVRWGFWVSVCVLSAAMWSFILVLPVEWQQQTLDRVALHGLVQTLAVPAWGIIYLKSRDPNAPALRLDSALTALFALILAIGVSLLFDVNPYARGIGFALAYWVFAAMELRPQQNRAAT